MPLDVQPLSRARKVVMLLVMLGLLAASLGLAEVLVKQRSGKAGEPVMPRTSHPKGTTGGGEWL